MKKRYLRNMSALSEEDMVKLNKSRVCVIGCGGLGGYIIEMLARVGVGYITAIDGDVFDETNLNRQLLCNICNIGLNKADEARNRIKVVNPDIVIDPIVEMIDESNVDILLKGHDLVVDALDNIKTRRMLQKHSSKLKIPMVHGAIAGFYGQVTTIYPEDNTLDLIYSGKSQLNKGIEKELGNPSFTPALIASIQVAEVIKVLLNKGEPLRKKVLFIDLLNNSFDVVDFS